MFFFIKPASLVVLLCLTLQTKGQSSYSLESSILATQSNKESYTSTLSLKSSSNVITSALTMPSGNSNNGHYQTSTSLFNKLNVTLTTSVFPASKEALASSPASGLMNSVDGTLMSFTSSQTSILMNKTTDALSPFQTTNIIMASASALQSPVSTSTLPGSSSNLVAETSISTVSNQTSTSIYNTTDALKTTGILIASASSSQLPVSMSTHLKQAASNSLHTASSSFVVASVSSLQSPGDMTSSSIYTALSSLSPLSSSTTGALNGTKVGASSQVASATMQAPSSSLSSLINVNEVSKTETISPRTPSSSLGSQSSAILPSVSGNVSSMTQMASESIGSTPASVTPSLNTAVVNTAGAVGSSTLSVNLSVQSPFVLPSASEKISIMTETSSESIVMSPTLVTPSPDITLVKSETTNFGTSSVSVDTHLSSILPSVSGNMSSITDMPSESILLSPSSPTLSMNSTVVNKLETVNSSTQSVSLNIQSLSILASVSGKISSVTQRASESIVVTTSPVTQSANFSMVKRSETVNSSTLSSSVDVESSILPSLSGAVTAITQTASESMKVSLLSPTQSVNATVASKTEIVNSFTPSVSLDAQSSGSIQVYPSSATPPLNTTAVSTTEIVNYGTSSGSLDAQSFSTMPSVSGTLLSLTRIATESFEVAPSSVMPFVNSAIINSTEAVEFRTPSISLDTQSFSIMPSVSGKLLSMIQITSENIKVVPSPATPSVSATVINATEAVGFSSPSVSSGIHSSSTMPAISGTLSSMTQVAPDSIKVAPSSVTMSVNPSTSNTTETVGNSTPSPSFKVQRSSTITSVSGTVLSMTQFPTASIDVARSSSTVSLHISLQTSSSFATDILSVTETISPRSVASENAETSTMSQSMATDSLPSTGPFLTYVTPASSFFVEVSSSSYALMSGIEGLSSTLVLSKGSVSAVMSGALASRSYEQSTGLVSVSVMPSSSSVDLGVNETIMSSDFVSATSLEVQSSAEIPGTSSASVALSETMMISQVVPTSSLIEVSVTPSLSSVAKSFNETDTSRLHLSTTDIEVQSSTVTPRQSVTTVALNETMNVSPVVPTSSPVLTSVTQSSHVKRSVDETKSSSLFTSKITSEVVFSSVTPTLSSASVVLIETMTTSSVAPPSSLVARSTTPILSSATNGFNETKTNSLHLSTTGIKSQSFTVTPSKSMTSIVLNETIATSSRTSLLSSIPVSITLFSASVTKLSSTVTRSNSLASVALKETAAATLFIPSSGLTSLSVTTLSSSVIIGFNQTEAVSSLISTTIIHRPSSTTKASTIPNSVNIIVTRTASLHSQSVITARASLYKSSTVSSYVLSVQPSLSVTQAIIPTTVVVNKTETGSSKVAPTATQVRSSTPASPTSSGIAVSSVPPTNSPPVPPKTTSKPTLEPDNRLKIRCSIKFNVTFKESFLQANSKSFNDLKERVVPHMASVYEKYLQKFEYHSVSVISFSDGKRLGTAMLFDVVLKKGEQELVVLKEEVQQASLNHLEGKVFKSSPYGIEFHKNSFELVEERKVVPTKEEEIIVFAKIKITSKTFSENLTKPATTEYKKLKFDIELTLNRTYQDLPGFIMAIVKKFSQGSVIVDYELIFDTKTAGKDQQELTNKVKSTTEKSIEDGKLGDFNVTKDSFVVTGVETKTSKATGTSSKTPTWVIVLVVSCIVVAALLVLLASQCRKVRHYRDELDIYDDAEDGTPELKMKRLKTTSKYLSSFEGIPRAKMMETSLDNNLQDDVENNGGVINKSFVMSMDLESQEMAQNGKTRTKESDNLLKTGSSEGKKNA